MGISRSFVLMLTAALSKEPFMSCAWTRQQFGLIDSLCLDTEAVLKRTVRRDSGLLLSCGRRLLLPQNPTE